MKAFQDEDEDEDGEEDDGDFYSDGNGNDQDAEEIETEEFFTDSGPGTGAAGITTPPLPTTLYSPLPTPPIAVSADIVESMLDLSEPS